MAPVIVCVAIAVLLLLVLRFRIPAYLALLLVSLGSGLALGMDTDAVITAVQDGMGSTLGFVAVVVGLGAMLGALLEYSGGIHKLAMGLLQKAGSDRAAWGLCLLGFLVSIPVFLDVAFIILVPLLYSLARDSKTSVLYFALPTLAGLLVAHSFIPPTPGPIAVAGLLQADLGLVIVFGMICGIPSMVLAGPVFAHRWRTRPPESFLLQETTRFRDDSEIYKGLDLKETLLLIFIPLCLIVAATLATQFLDASLLLSVLTFTGHPFTALALTTLIAFILLRTRGAGKEQLSDCMGKALEPAGIVVLVTGAGGVFKQILTDSGAGLVLAEMFSGTSSLPVVFAFLVALMIRISQGSATVAMITAAGLVAPVRESLQLTGADNALLVVAIAAGASAFSHVNDSGFWLVSRYLHLDTRETLKTWTVLSGIVGGCGFIMALMLSLLF